MALVVADPSSRARRDEHAPDFYQAYLNSPEWRRVRNAALERARYRCWACGSGRDLQVHHLTYVRLGREWPSDLLVVCFTCHRGHHRQEAEATPLGIYLKLVSEIVRDDPWARIADIADEAKRLCIARRIPQDVPAIDRAIMMVCATRLRDHGHPYTSVVEVTPESPPITHAQACELLERIPVGDAIRTMPRDPVPLTEDDVNRFRQRFVWTVPDTGEECD